MILSSLTKYWIYVQQQRGDYRVIHKKHHFTFYCTAFSFSVVREEVVIPHLYLFIFEVRLIYPTDKNIWFQIEILCGHDCKKT